MIHIPNAAMSKFSSNDTFGLLIEIVTQGFRHSASQANMRFGRKLDHGTFHSTDSLCNKVTQWLSHFESQTVATVAVMLERQMNAMMIALHRRLAECAQKVVSVHEIHAMKQHENLGMILSWLQCQASPKKSTSSRNRMMPEAEVRYFERRNETRGQRVWRRTVKKNFKLSGRWVES